MLSQTTHIQQAIQILRQASHAAALTGAGISTPSGIPDFRSTNHGLWDEVDPMAVASIYAFRKNPKTFYNWVHPLLGVILNAAPNPAHQALAYLEKYGPLKAIITQNIDMLHTRAGSQTVLEVHGHLRQATCIHCFASYQAEEVLPHFMTTKEIPLCPHCGGVLKPDVILFGEVLPVRILNEAQRQARLCDVLLVAGSSLAVAPAGDLPLLAMATGAKLIIINKEATPLDEMADVVIHGDVVDVLPQLAGAFHRGGVNYAAV
ncbi:MAG: NAD-dependent protein deacylase Cob2 [Candidatus Promineifilaceae bacterium]